MWETCSFISRQGTVTHLGERVHRSDKCTRIRVRDLEFHPESHSPSIKCSIRCLLPLKLIFFNSVQFSHSVTSTLCDPMDCSMPGFPVHHQFPELTQTHFHWVGWCHPAISSSVIPFCCLQSFPASGSSPMSQFFESGGQSIGVSASASVLSMNIQDWFLQEFSFILFFFNLESR